MNDEFVAFSKQEEVIDEALKSFFNRKTDLESSLSDFAAGWLQRPLIDNCIHNSNDFQKSHNDLLEVKENVKRSALKASDINSKLVHINKEQEKVTGLFSIMEGFEKLESIYQTLLQEDKSLLESQCLAIKEYRDLPRLPKVVFVRAKDLTLEKMETLVSKKVSLAVHEIERERCSCNERNATNLWDSKYRLFRLALCVGNSQLACDILSEAWLDILAKVIENNENANISKVSLFQLALKEIASIFKSQKENVASWDPSVKYIFWKTLTPKLHAFFTKRLEFYLSERKVIEMRDSLKAAATATLGEGKNSSSSSSSQSESESIIEVDKVLSEIEVVVKMLYMYMDLITENTSRELMLEISSDVISKKWKVLLELYSDLEKVYFTLAVKKAIAVDQYQESSKASSYVDDSFFILIKSVKRSFAILEKNNSISLIRFCINFIITMVYGKMEKALSNYVDPDGGQSPFIVALNDTIAVKSFLDRTMKELNYEMQSIITPTCVLDWSSQGSFDSDFHGQVSALFLNLSDKFSTLYEKSVANLTRWLKNEISKIFPKASAKNENIRDLCGNLITLWKSLDRALFHVNQDILAEMRKRFSDLCAEEFEKTVLALRAMTLSDCLRLDQSIREMVGVFSKSNVLGFRSSFSKIFQIMTILTIDKVTDIYDFMPFEHSNIDASFVKSVLRIRAEFKEETIINLSL